MCAGTIYLFERARINSIITTHIFLPTILMAWTTTGCSLNGGYEIIGYGNGTNGEHIHRRASYSYS